MGVVLVTTWMVECGIATYSKALAQALVAQGDRVTILAEKDPRAPQETKLADEGGISAYRLWDRRSPYEAPSGLGMLKKAILSSATRPSIVHVQHEFGLFPDDPGLFRFLRELHDEGIRAIVTLHTVTGPPKYVGFFRSFAREGHRAIVHTETAHAALAAWGHKNTRSIPHGVAIHEPPKQLLRAVPLIVCPGFMGESKGQIEIVEAAAEMRRFTDRFQIALVGRCRDERYLHQLKCAIREHGLAEQVTLEEGFASEIAMHDWLTSASVVVLGSGKTTPYSASGQLHTAYGYGLPVVAKNVPIYRDGGPALHYDTPKECAFLLRGLLEDPAAIASQARLSREIAQKRRWPVVAAQTRAAYA